MNERNIAKCGYVALIGAPNAGKSTLLNALVGAKLSIVSPKVQTTRTRVLGILTEDEVQMVFVDTPGIFRPRRRLDRAMVAAAWGGAEDADVIVLLVDVTRRQDEETEAIVARLKETNRRAILALNKIDLVKREKLLEIAARMDAHGIFDEVFMISAQTGDGLADLKRRLIARMPEGPWLFPEDELSDMPMRLLAAEITREKLFNQLYQEVPYSLTVETESWEDRDDGSAMINQTIYVERDSQKGIILGKGGRQIKAVGEAARLDLEAMLERRVHLKLFVKVRPEWGEDPERYRDWNLDYKA